MGHAGRWLMVDLIIVGVLAGVLTRCGPGRSAPPGLSFPRAAPPPRVRVERLLDTPRGEAGVALPRVSGSFRVVSLGDSVRLPFAQAVVLERSPGERPLLLLIDHHPDHRLSAEPGERIELRFATRRSADGPSAGLLIRDAKGALRYLSVLRPPDSRPFGFESALPDDLRPRATDDLVYLERRREESYCVVERGHYEASISTAGGERRLRPGALIVRTLEDGTVWLHLADVSRVTQTDCPTRPASFIAYEVFGPEPL